MKAARIVLRGIKCDAPGCDYRDMHADVSVPEEWLNRPCPKCGAPLITPLDLRALGIAVALAELVSAVEGPKPENADLVYVPLIMDGTGSFDIGTPGKAGAR